MNRQTPHTLKNSFNLFADMINHINKLADNPWRVGCCYECGNLCTGYELPSTDQEEHQVLRVICQKCLAIMPQDFIDMNGISDIVCPQCHKVDNTRFVTKFGTCPGCDHVSANP